MLQVLHCAKCILKKIHIHIMLFNRSCGTSSKMSKKDLSMSSHTETHVFDPVKYIKAYYSGPENFPCQLEKETVEWALDNIYRIFDGGIKRFNSYQTIYYDIRTA